MEGVRPEDGMGGKKKCTFSGEGKKRETGSRLAIHDKDEGITHAQDTGQKWMIEGGNTVGKCEGEGGLSGGEE